MTVEQVLQRLQHLPPQAEVVVEVDEEVRDIQDIGLVPEPADHDVPVVVVGVSYQSDFSYDELGL